MAKTAPALAIRKHATRDTYSGEQEKGKSGPEISLSGFRRHR
jgi:hypothetical protein